MNRSVPCKQITCRRWVWLLLIVLAAGLPAAHGQQASSSETVNATRPAAHPIDPALRMAQASLQHLQASVDDYTALFVKRCRVDGELPPLQYARVKIRNRKVRDGAIATPMAVYLHFLKPADVQGREVIWVEDQNQGNLVVHEAGIKGLVNVYLDPHGYMAMRGQRYAITDIGIENLLVKLIETGLRDAQHGECEVQFYPDAQIGDVACTMLEVVHPVERPHFDFYRARVYFDKQLNLPIRYESCSWPAAPGEEPPVEEEYTYLQLKTNVGLTANDFDIANPDYRFR